MLLTAEGEAVCGRDWALPTRPRKDCRHLVIWFAVYA